MKHVNISFDNGWTRNICSSPNIKSTEFRIWSKECPEKTCFFFLTSNIYSQILTELVHLLKLEEDKICLLLKTSIKWLWIKAINYCIPSGLSCSGPSIVTCHVHKMLHLITKKNSSVICWIIMSHRTPSSGKTAIKPLFLEVK